MADSINYRGLGTADCVSDFLIVLALASPPALANFLGGGLAEPRFAARPGYSEHGWGLAVDLSCGVQSFRTKQHAWLVTNAGTYGWFLPEWAQRGGARPEPWHWEFSGE